MTLSAFAHQLPVWTLRDAKCAGGEIAVLVLVDGTLVTAFEASGVDVFSADNARLNKNAAAYRRALNALRPGEFLQCEWHTALPHDALIREFAARGAGATGAAHAVLVEQRRARARALAADKSLARGRHVYFIGQSRALGLLAGHRFSLLARFVSGRRDPQMITPEGFADAAECLAETAARVRAELGTTGSELRPLDRRALLNELHRVLNPASSSVVPLTPVDRPEELPEALTRAPPYLIHRPLTLREQLPLGDLTWTESTFTLDDPPLIHRALSVERLPAFTRPDFLMGIQFCTNARFRLISTFMATDREKLTERLIRKRNIAHAQAGGIVRDVAADIAHSEYERVLETMLTNDQRIFEASVTVIVDAPDHGALDKATREIRDAFSAVGAALTTETGRQLPSFLGSLPGNGPHAPKTHQLITNNAADLIPGFTPGVGDDEAQIVLHTRQNTPRKLSVLPSSLRANNNIFAAGVTGGGKTFGISCIVEQACLIEGGPLLIVDVQGPELSSYRVLAEALGGSYVALSASDDIAFNPFFSHDEIIVKKDGGAVTFDDEAVRYLADLAALMALPDLERRPDRSFARLIARECILSAYHHNLSERRTPILSDVVSILERYIPTEPEYASLAREMFLKLKAWTTDPTRARLLDRPTRYPGARQMQVFDLFGLEKDKELATVLLLSVSFHIWSTIRRYPRNVLKFVVFDECWKFLQDETASGIVAELFRTGRKWNTSTWALTQSLTDFLASPIHAAVLQNAARAILFQHACDHEKVAALLDLNARQLALFKQLRFKKGQFAEMLLVERGRNEASILKLKPTPFDLWLNTSDPVDVALRQRVMRERRLSLLDAIRFCAERYPSGAPKARRTEPEGAAP